MLYGYEFDSRCFQSVRTRRAVLAREIDAVAARRPGAHVLAVASGHLREIEWSRAARSGAVTITAIDQDCGGAAIAILAPWWIVKIAGIGMSGVGKHMAMPRESDRRYLDLRRCCTTSRSTVRITSTHAFRSVTCRRRSNRSNPLSPATSSSSGGRCGRSSR